MEHPPFRLTAKDRKKAKPSNEDAELRWLQAGAQGCCAQQVPKSRDFDAQRLPLLLEMGARPESRRISRAWP